MLEIQRDEELWEEDLGPSAPWKDVAEMKEETQQHLGHRCAGAAEPDHQQEQSHQ